MSHPLPITAVTVHPDGAIVTRRGALPIVDGRAEVRALPLLLDEASLRAAAQGARVRGLKLDLDLEGVERGEEHELLRAWQAAERRIRLLKSRQAGLEKQRSRLDDLRPPAPKDARGDERAPGVAQLRAWRQLCAHLDTQTHALHERIAQLRRELDEANEDLRLALFNLARSSNEALWRRWAPTRVLTLEVDGGDAQELVLELSYRVEGARWAPAYALHADAALNSGRLVRRAVVAQASGEDWRGVALTLCSSPCARQVSLPELPSLRLGEAQAPARPAWRPLPPGLDALFPSADLSEPGPRAAPALPFPDALPSVDELAAKASPPPAPPEAEAWDAEEDDFGAVEELSAPVFADAPLRDEGAAFGGVGGGGAPRPPPALAARMMSAAAPAPMAPPMPSSAPMPKKRKGAPSPSRERAAPPGAAPSSLSLGAQLAPEPSPELEPGADLMDYPRLRLAPFHAPRGQRGRLRALPLHAEVRAAGLPDDAAKRLIYCVGERQAATRRVKAQRLPPKHVVPGPVDGAFVRLDAQGQVDVPSDGQFTQLALGSSPTELQLSYRSVPREDPRVFRRLLVKLGGDAPLLPGPVDVYVAGALLRSFELSQGSRGARITIGLGAEDGLRVARNARYREETAGLLRGSRRLHTEVEVEIASALTRLAEIELLERLPLAGDDSVQVKQEGSDPPAQEWKGEPGEPQLAGGRRQLLRVPAGGLARATFHYSVTMDNKLELQGGDRRG